MGSTSTTESSIKIEHRGSRSVANHALLKVVDTFRSVIMKPADPLPKGSPQLTPHKSAYKACKIREYQVASCYLYGFSRSEIPPGEDAGSPRHRLFYFAGGGFRGAPTKEHWLLCAELCINLPEYEVNLVSYPLAPNSPAPQSIPQLERMYQAFAEESRWRNTRITFMGDSAGGNIALVLGLYGATEYLKAESAGACPVQGIFAICPAVDHRNNHPDIDEVELRDSILSRKTIEEVSDLWSGDWLVDDPRVSPTLADLSVLQKAKVKVDGILAMDDVLTPDALLFREKLADAGVVGNWLDWEKQMHCFPLMFSYHIHEPAEAMKWIQETLRKNVVS